MDVESLKKSGSSRVRCLDAFLVVSIVLLFAAVGVLTVGLFFGTKAETASSPQPYASDVGDKMQNVAYLKPHLRNLENGTMRWTAVSRGAGNSVGSLFDFNPDHHSIRTTRDGQYFIYIELKLNCSTTPVCDAGRFTVSIGDSRDSRDSRLTCNFELPEWKETTPVYRKCWQVTRMDKEMRLVTQMTAQQQLNKWTIDVAASEQGIYLVG
ncbi:uncharacterized protein LOC132453759 [Gadus macrocephalus]|uniref:uncharacterized protein LOC132453759 n=1 Tax=Gadus macrocephalus TaxID=80720 RepID=UPI0028CB25CA|nr:uncharacterized protein LOC132453759 [Gadus macrocephalus]